MKELQRDTIFFLFGPARGGTTYLNNLLFDWFDFSMGPEGTFFLPLFDKKEKFGDLEIAENRYRLASEICQSRMLRIIRERYPPELKLDIKPEEILEAAAGNSFADVVFATFEVLARSWGNSRIGTKNPAFWKSLAAIEQLFPKKAKYICIVRDCRDVFLSLQHVRWGKQNAYFTAREWKNLIQSVESFREKIGQDRLLLIKYEALLKDPDSTLSALESFIGTPLSPEKREEFLRTAMSNPMRDNAEKWKTRLALDDRTIFEAVAGEEIKRMGYPTLSSPSKIPLHRVVRFNAEEIIRLFKLNMNHLLVRSRGNLPQPVKDRTQG